MVEMMSRSELIDLQKSELVAVIDGLRSCAGLPGLPCGSRKKDVMRLYYLDLVREYHEAYDLAHQKEKKMAKAEGNGKTKEKSEVVAIPERRALEVLGEILWNEADERPVVSEMTDDQVRMELSDNIAMLEKDDQPQVLEMDGGAEAWEIFVGLKKELAAESVAGVKEDKATKTKEKKAPSEKKAKADLNGEYTPGSSAQTIVDIVKASKKPIDLKDIATKLSAMVDSGKLSCKNPEGRAKQMLADATKRGIVIKADGLYTYHQK